jgi:hypothetical protein
MPTSLSIAFGTDRVEKSMIFNLILASAILVFASNSPFKSEGDAADYLYMNMNGGPVVGFYKDNPKVQIQDLIVDANDCSTNTAVCVEAEGVFVAIPNRSVGYTSDGTKVEVVKEMDVTFIGVRAHVRLVEATRSSTRFQFWYSNDVGLLAFSISSEGKTATYLLEQTVGLKAGWKGEVKKSSNQSR